MGGGSLHQGGDRKSLRPCPTLEQNSGRLTWIKGHPGGRARSRARLGLFAALAALLAASCGSSAAPPPQARKLRAILAEHMPELPPEKLPEQKRRFKEAAVYVDGNPVGVLKHAELPPALPVRPQRLKDGRDVPRWRVAEYLEALGVKLDKVRAAHFVGGRDRATIIAGDELRKHRNTLLFSFTRGDSGRPRMHWPPEGIAINTSIDTVSTVLLYVDKEPPHYDPKEHEFSFADGKSIEGVPYAQPEEALKGTRVYVDGQLAVAMKRKKLPNSMLLPGTDSRATTFSLALWLASAGVDPAAARGVDLLSGEDLITRLGPKEWAVEKGSLSFSLPRRSQGRILLHLPPEDPAVKSAAAAVPDPSLRVSAIMIYKNVTPPAHPLAPLAELVADDKAGSGKNQGDGENGGDGRGSGTARDVQNEDPEP
jgi:hypothetical protein